MDGLQKLTIISLVGKFSPFLECESLLLYYQNPISDPHSGTIRFYPKFLTHTHKQTIPRTHLILSFHQQLLSNIQIISPILRSSCISHVYIIPIQDILPHLILKPGLDEYSDVTVTTQLLYLLYKFQIFHTGQCSHSQTLSRNL